jgi:hypothetical protein
MCYTQAPERSSLRVPAPRAQSPGALLRSSGRSERSSPPARQRPFKATSCAPLLLLTTPRLPTGFRSCLFPSSGVWIAFAAYLRHLSLLDYENLPPLCPLDTPCAGRCTLSAHQSHTERNPLRGVTSAYMVGGLYFCWAGGGKLCAPHLARWVSPTSLHDLSVHNDGAGSVITGRDSYSY